MDATGVMTADVQRAVLVAYVHGVVTSSRLAVHPKMVSAVLEVMAVTACARERAEGNSPRERLAGVREVAGRHGVAVTTLFRWARKCMDGAPEAVRRAMENVRKGAA